MKLVFLLCLFVVALDLGATHKPLDREIRRIKRRQRSFEAQLGEMNNKCCNNKTTEIIDAPYLFVCGAQDEFEYTAGWKVMPFDKLMINFTNILNSGGLEIDSGIFTAPISAIYSVSYGMTHWAYSGEARVDMYLRKNGVNIYETKEMSQYTGSSGYVDQGFGREMPIYLEAGETLDLYVYKAEHIWYTTFCLTLIKPVDGAYAGLIMTLSLDDDANMDQDLNN